MEPADLLPRLFGPLLQNLRADGATLTGLYAGNQVQLGISELYTPWDGMDGAKSECIELAVAGLPRELLLSVAYRRSSSFPIGGPPSCKTGDAAFDRSFTVDGAPRRWIADLLTRNVRAGLLRHRWIELVVNDGTLILRCFEPISKPKDAESFLTLSASLRTHALEARARTIATALQTPSLAGLDSSEAEARALDRERAETAAFVRARAARTAATKRIVLAVQVLLAAMMLWYFYHWRGP